MQNLAKGGRRSPARGLERPKAFIKNKAFTGPTPFCIFFKNALTGSGAFSWRDVALVNARFGVAFSPIHAVRPRAGLRLPPFAAFSDS